MKKLPEEEKQKIAQQVEVFRVEKRAFDREVRPLVFFKGTDQRESWTLFGSSDDGLRST